MGRLAALDSKGCQDAAKAALRLFEFVFPQAQCAPAALSHFMPDTAVASFVSGKLLQPKGTTGGRERSMLRAAMPKTAIHEDRESVFSETKVGRTGQFLVAPPARNPVCAKEVR